MTTTAMPRVEIHQFSAFGGARCEVMAAGASVDDLSRAVAEVYAFEARLTRFSPQSELSAFNRSAGRRVAVSPLLEALLRASLDAYQLSGGLVNAAVLPALLAAGYDRTIEAVRRHQPVVAVVDGGARPAPPLPAVLTVGRGWAELEPGCAVDLGGVGKGWLADRLCERLGDAVVNLGGDLRALGEGPEGEGWCIGLCDGSAVLIHDAGVATSGTAGRRWAGGHHLIDPRTGLPAPTDVAALSVVAADAFRAEVIAKAAALCGSDDGPRLARDLGAARVATVREQAAVALDR